MKIYQLINVILFLLELNLPQVWKAFHISVPFYSGWVVHFISLKLNLNTIWKRNLSALGVGIINWSSQGHF